MVEGWTDCWQEEGEFIFLEEDTFLNKKDENYAHCVFVHE